MKVIQKRFEQVGMGGTEETPCGGGAVWACEEIVVDMAERLEPVGGDVVQTMVPERHLPVSALDAGAGALE